MVVVVTVMTRAVPHHGCDDSGRANGSCGSSCNGGSGIDGGGEEGSCGGGECDGGSGGNGNSNGSGKTTKTMVVTALVVRGNTTIN